MSTEPLRVVTITTQQRINESDAEYPTELRNGLLAAAHHKAASAGRVPVGDGKISVSTGAEIQMADGTIFDVADGLVQVRLDIDTKERP